MQINRLNDAVPKRLNRQSSENNKRNVSNKATASINNNIANKQKPSFKGLGGIDTFCLGLANLIENGGLLVSFTLQDMLGTNLPRPIMGLRRNKNENEGKSNKKFALKELVREMTTGPSMFLIPMAMLAPGKKIFGKTINVPMKQIKSFGEVHAEKAVSQAGKAISKEDFYKNTFTEIIKNAKLEDVASEGTIAKAEDFAKRLSDAAVKGKKTVKQTLTDLSDDFVGIAKKHANDAAHTDFTMARVKGASAPFKETVSHMMSYADDVVEKVASKGKPAKELPEYIKKVSNNKVLGRLATNVIMYAAVMTFLQVIPRMYNKAEGEKNAGLTGLMKEETLNDKKEETKKPNDKKDKSKVSFGSLEQFASKATKTLTGDGVIGKMARGIEFEGYNVSFPLLLGIMGFGILFPRIKNAKDKYDREEIVRRDLVTCATMCFAEKELRKGFSKLKETESGLVLAAKGENFKNQKPLKKVFDYLRPIKGVHVLSSDQIVSKYSGVDKYKDGLAGFCEFIGKEGGNLSKVFSLTEDSSKLATKILGQDLKGASNEKITNAIKKNIDSEDVKKLTEMFNKPDNAWVKKAKTLNARFTALSVLVLVPLFLGFALPAINEKATKNRIKKEEAEKQAAKINNLNNQVFAPKTAKVFDDINPFLKK